jgi:CheY-like chemotaxis protein
VNLSTTDPTATLEPVIVLVDDEKPFTDLMGALLEQGLGVKTVVFNDPVAALESMSSHHPTLVISDYRMPRLDGFDFKAVAARHRAPSILITGNSSTGDHHDAQARRAAQRALQTTRGARSLA